MFSTLKLFFASMFFLTLIFMITGAPASQLVCTETLPGWESQIESISFEYLKLPPPEDLKQAYISASCLIWEKIQMRASAEEIQRAQEVFVPAYNALLPYRSDSQKLTVASLEAIETWLQFAAKADAMEKDLKVLTKEEACELLYSGPLDNCSIDFAFLGSDFTASILLNNRTGHFSYPDFNVRRPCSTVLTPETVSDLWDCPIDVIGQKDPILGYRWMSGLAIVWYNWQ